MKLSSDETIKVKGYGFSFGIASYSEGGFAAASKEAVKRFRVDHSQRALAGLT